VVERSGMSIHPRLRVTLLALILTIRAFDLKTTLNDLYGLPRPTSIGIILFVSATDDTVSLQFSSRMSI